MGTDGNLWSLSNGTFESVGASHLPRLLSRSQTPADPQRLALRVLLVDTAFD